MCKLLSLEFIVTTFSCLCLLSCEANKECENLESFQCDDGKCIAEALRCDTYENCDNGEDERNCTELKCSSDKFSCSNKKLCISRSWVCDGDKDCQDGSDELNCDKIVCNDNEFKCKTGRCIPLSARCDFQVDCRGKEGEDELDCPYADCSGDKFPCNTTRRLCLDRSWVCDGDIDCPDGSDEFSCGEPVVCKAGQFQCDAKCIPLNFKCDMDRDCIDGQDELNCSAVNTTEGTVALNTTEGTAALNSTLCELDMFRCGNGSCITSSKHCDNTTDCSDASDEINCTEKSERLVRGSLVQRQKRQLGLGNLLSPAGNQNQGRRGPSCLTANRQRGKCLPMDQCVLKELDEDYVKNKGYLCLITAQGPVGVCCPDSIAKPVVYREGMFGNKNTVFARTRGEAAPDTPEDVEMLN